MTDQNEENYEEQSPPPSQPRPAKNNQSPSNTHYKPTDTFQYTHFASCHPPGVKYGFIKGEAIRLLRTNSSKKTFEESLLKFKQRLRSRGYPENIIERSLSGVTFASRQSALAQKKKKGHERLLPFVTTYHPAVKNLKQILMEHWSLIQNQPLLKTIFEKPPIISYKKRGNPSKTRS